MREKDFVARSAALAERVQIGFWKFIIVMGINGTMTAKIYRFYAVAAIIMCTHGAGKYQNSDVSLLRREEIESISRRCRERDRHIS